MQETLMWKTKCVALNLSMQKEIETMREVLTNLRREENLILSVSATLLPEVLSERARLLARLEALRGERLAAIKELIFMNLPHKPITSVELEHILPLDNEEGCEALLLRDQLAALAERMDLQKLRNEMFAKRFTSVKTFPSKPELVKKKLLVLEEGEEELV